MIFGVIPKTDWKQGGWSTDDIVHSRCQERISIIIPALNEAARLAACLPASSNDVEVIVADGGSRDGTPQAAEARGWRVCLSEPGRAKQMNAGAELASGEILLFLHADTRLPENFAVHVHRILANPDFIAGAFRLRIDSELRGIRAIETLANWRSIHWQMPYGDQAIFLRAERFRAIGGFPYLPIMEDVELIRRLRKQGRIGIAPVPAVTSARRWVEKGLWKTTLHNQAYLAAYYLGVPPSRIRDWYDGGKRSQVRWKEQSQKTGHMRENTWGVRHGR